MSCEREAAENGLHCKHRINLAAAAPEQQKLPSVKPADLVTLCQWLVGAPLGMSLSAITELKREAEKLKVCRSKAKSALRLALVTGPNPS
ncbi:hypothetical protein RX327_31545 [Bradyrhizobium sp. BEA-2-5]|uniref:hypothetical protein n=1 Tax=Bradyrhizobium sp. BEA-2-5 TaxID=3080015 RepID=UPI00293EE61E|nr:hypothetical protein [Bradyrhizobium sp. BEA-2-5]WOH80309.1 hypothetical protein RX327_31545 [Bradyrhizobium sp. BEA-2-5]